MSDDTFSCQWCGAVVKDYDSHQHTAWHKANHLHGDECAALEVPKDSRGLKSCDCGLKSA